MVALERFPIGEYFGELALFAGVEQAVMRAPFVITVEVPTDPSQKAYWKELTWSDALKLRRFFRDIMEFKIQEFIREDGKDSRELTTPQMEQYRKEANDMMFALRKFPLSIDQLLPIFAGLALPNILRLGQSSADKGKGLFGKYHFGILRNESGSDVLAVATMEKTNQPDEAEIALWLHPATNRALVYRACVEFLDWGQKTAGYLHFRAHTDAKTDRQRGNRAAILVAGLLGFIESGVLTAGGPDGNSKTTVVLKARHWSRAAQDSRQSATASERSG